MPTYTYRWDEREHAHVVRAVTKHMLAGRWFLWIPWMMMGLAAVLLFAVLLFPAVNRGELLERAIPWLLMIGLWAVFFRRFMGWSAARQFRRESKDALHPLGLGVSAEGVDVSSHTGSTRLNWQGIRGVVETPEFFLFYVTTRCAHYLPKHVLGSEDELREIRRLVRAHAPEQVQLLDTPAP